MSSGALQKNHGGQKNAYIFSSVNNKKKRFKAMCSNGGENAIWGSALDGPRFGFHDIHIACYSKSKVSSITCPLCIQTF